MSEKVTVESVEAISNYQISIIEGFSQDIKSVPKPEGWVGIKSQKSWDKNKET